MSVHQRTRRFRRGLAALLGAVVCSGAVPATASAGRGGSGVGDPYYPQDGNSGYNVSHYDVRLSYDPSRPDHLSGDTTVTAKATEKLDRFNLDLKGFKVASVTVDGRRAKKVAREGEHELVITPAQAVAKGAKFTTRVTYAGEPDNEGWHTLKNGGAFALGEPHSATSWFPADDHPSDKATFQLTATVPDGWTVMGNGLRGRTTTEGGKKTFRWHEDKPLATYLATVAIDKFTVHEDELADGTPVITAWPPRHHPRPGGRGRAEGDHRVPVLGLRPVPVLLGRRHHDRGDGGRRGHQHDGPGDPEPAHLPRPHLRRLGDAREHPPVVR
ncbi:hypothetical protein [Streptomyces sp. NPDC047108]|uniref:hypothetical protein n=1 Tax=Streptomyces sp. NPDC047108 TaxID=3155025 RepID=UPI0033D1241C